MKISLFLGAGASQLFGMPTTKEFRERLLEKYDKAHPVGKLLDCDGFGDIEHVLRALEDVEKVGTYGALLLNSIKAEKTNPDAHILNRLNSLKQDIRDSVYEFYQRDNINVPLKQHMYGWLFDLLMNNENILNVFTTNYDRIVEEYVSSRKDMKLRHGFKSNDDADKPLFSVNNFADRGGDDQKKRSICTSFMARLIGKKRMTRYISHTLITICYKRNETC